MERTPKNYWKLFTSTFTLSAFTFGGGFVIVPLMRRQFVEKLGWVDEDEMLDLTAIAQSSPGAIAVNASMLVGYRVAGFPGAVLTILGTVLPPFIILSVISLFYQAFRSNLYVGFVMKGMQAGVAAVICDVVISMGAEVLRDRKALTFLTLAGAFIATRFLRINVVWIILACGALGVWRAKHGEKAAAAVCAAPTEPSPEPTAEGGKEEK